MQYNSRLHDLEKKEAVDNKKTAQLRMRQMLAEQQEQQRMIVSNVHE